MQPQDFFSDLFNIGGQVADLASNIAGLIATDKQKGNSQQVYSLGDIAFAQDQGALFAGNASTTTPYLLNLSETSQVGTAISTTTAPVSIPPQSATNVTQLVNEFVGGGSYMICPQPTSTQANLTQAISFAIKALSFAAAVSIINGITASFGQNNDGTWTLSIMSTGPSIMNGSVNVTDVNGVSAMVNLVLGQGAKADGTQTCTANFPSGMALMPTVADLEVNLQISAASSLFIELDTVPLSAVPAFKKLARA